MLNLRFLTIPFGMITFFADYVIISTGSVPLLTISFCSHQLDWFTWYNFHLHYFLHDFTLEIGYNTKNNYVDFLSNGKYTRIYKEEIECIDKITKDGLFGRVPWWTYKIFKIKLKK